MKASLQSDRLKQVRESLSTNNPILSYQGLFFPSSDTSDRAIELPLKIAAPNMKLGYTTIYVPDVIVAIKFFSDAFGLSQRFLHESGDYAELDTGDTSLAFASHQLGEHNFPNGFVKASESDKPLGMEIALVTDNVATAHENAIRHGAREVSSPKTKPWGQTVSYIRCSSGILVELCTPIEVK